MSQQLAKLVTEILGRCYGELVQKVGNDLVTFGCKPISAIVKSTKLTRYQVVECLRALIKFDLVTFEPSSNEVNADYKIISEHVLYLLRYPRYLLQIKTKFGSIAELLIEEILQNGNITVSNLILNIAKKYKDDKEKNITIIALKDTLISLVTAGYIQQSPVVDNKVPSTDIPTLVPIVSMVPEVDVRRLMLALSSGDMSEITDNVYWKVNYDRFHQDFRDEIMIKAMTRRIDENAGELMRQLLLQMYVRTEPWSPVSNPVPTLELKDSCRLSAGEFPLLVQHLDQYLKVLEENGAGFVRRSGDSGGGQWTLALAEAAQRVLTDLLEHTVTEKLSSHAARIFRLILDRKYVEEDDIQKHAMLPNKLCKELTYKLMAEHFIQVQPIRKTGTGGALTKAIYLYNIDLHKTAHTVLEMTYRALNNTAARASAARKAHARLLDKQARVRTIVHGMRLRNEQQDNINDIEDTITPPERMVLQNIEKTLKQLGTAELELDKSLFIMKWFFMYKP